METEYKDSPTEIYIKVIISTESQVAMVNIFGQMGLISKVTSKMD